MRTLILALSVVLALSSRGRAQQAEPDRDGDRISDRNDKCPNDPEDQDGFQDEDGCPDPDNDIDGVIDASDKCPNQPETKNGFQDQDGCPDALPRVLEGRTTPHPDFADWVPPKGLPATPSITSKRPPPSATPVVPAIGRAPVPPARAPSAPSGYRCGTGGTLVVNQGCKCPAGRVERRDADEVALCDKSGDPAKPASGPTAPPKAANGDSPATSPATAMGKLVIIAKPTITPGPSWATVQIDGRPVGETPVITNLAEGSHIIAFTRGTTHKTLKVSVKAAETTKVTLELE